MEHKPVGTVIRNQRRQRRTRFWSAFGLLAVAGVAWAGLSKEPLRALDDGIFGFDVAPAMPVADFNIVEGPPPPIPTPIPPPPSDE